MRILERLGERGDPTIAQRQLGTPTTTVQQWCQQRASLPNHNLAKERGHDRNFHRTDDPPELPQSADAFWRWDG